MLKVNTDFDSGRSTQNFGDHAKKHICLSPPDVGENERKLLLMRLIVIRSLHWILVSIPLNSNWQIVARV